MTNKRNFLIFTYMEKHRIYVKLVLVCGCRCVLWVLAICPMDKQDGYTFQLVGKGILQGLRLKVNKFHLSLSSTENRHS